MTTAELCAHIDKAATAIKAACATMQATMYAVRNPKTAMRSALASEDTVLPKWKRLSAGQRLTLQTGDVLEFPKEHTVRTTYIRPNYNADDVAYLQVARHAQRIALTAEHAIAALRRFKPDNAKPKRVVADPDPHCPGWRDRPARYLSPEQMVREQFTGKALERELRRIK